MAAPRPPHRKESLSMTKYMLAVHMTDDQPATPMTEEDMRRGFEQVEVLEQEMKAAKALVFSGRLLEPSRARVVRPVRNRIKVIDGPYAETKEHLGGFYIIEATDDDAALEWASKVTLAINTAIELRPLATDPRE
jgi:hypothetical protein